MSVFDKIILPDANKHTHKHDFTKVREFREDQLGFQEILSKVQAGTPFIFSKLNHGFWDRLAKLERLGISRDQFSDWDGAELDALLDIPKSNFFEGGIAKDLLEWIGTKPNLEDNIIFVPSLIPYPDAHEVSGAMQENTNVCRDLINHYVSEEYLKEVSDRGFSGHELKLAVYTGGLRKLLDALSTRNVIAIASPQCSDFLGAVRCKAGCHIQIDGKLARRNANQILDDLLSKIQEFSNDSTPPVILSSGGGALTNWLGFKLADYDCKVQYIDLGGVMAAFSTSSLHIPWIRYNQQNVAAGMAKILGRSHPITQFYRGQTGIRSTSMVSFAAQNGVPIPTSWDEMPAPMPASPVSFIENKVYDQSRIDDFLSLSTAQNHHANSGPVSSLLERTLAGILSLPKGREVVAVSSGTAALHLAAAIETGQRPNMRWVASAFNFFSCGIGPLSNSHILDCDKNGRFDLEALKALPLDSYDGVVYTNIFAQQTSWDDVADFCRVNQKAFVVDNATGLFSRPQSSYGPDAPMEAISAHHTKPWGVGEGGFVICSSEQAATVRQLANFGGSLSVESARWATNAKLSDLASAAILDRLEQADFWMRYYQAQEVRMHSIVRDAERNIRSFGIPGKITTVRAHTPFLAPHPVDLKHPDADGPVTLRKYYKPVRTGHPENVATPNADDLFARIFCLSNAPEMRTVPNAEIITQVRKLIDASQYRDTRP